MTHTLSDICSFVDERVNVSSLDSDTYISTENMLPNKEGITRSAGLPTASQTRAYRERDVLVSNIRPYFRKIWFADRDGGCSNDILVLRAKRKCHPEFLYYLLSNNDFFDYATATAKGTKMPRGDKSAIMRYEAPALPLGVQIKISDILTSLDSRIVLNKQINHYLEQMAQVIFKSWFVDFEPFANGKFVESELGEIPVGWSVQSIEYLAEKVAMGPFGSNIKVETFVESGVPIISGNHLRGLYLNELGYNFITEEHARRLSNSLVRAGDIIFTHAGNVGQVALIPGNCDYPYYVISQRQFYLRCNKQKALPEYVNYFFHSREGQGKLLANASQTGVPSIARPSSHLKAIAVVLPPIDVQIKWFATVEPMLQTLNSNNKESKRLASIRDALLPRLISGELSVADIDAAK
jgi:type I restriction enzyme S subunit